jgi:hypothetical protein
MSLDVRLSAAHSFAEEHQLPAVPLLPPIRNQR